MVVSVTWRGSGAVPGRFGLGANEGRHNGVTRPGGGLVNAGT